MKLNKKELYMRILTWFCRIIVGCTFVFSGVIKANDPIGSSYKMSEYFNELFHVDWLIPFSLPIVFVLIVIEIMVGIMCLTGMFMRVTSWILLLMTLFFGYLTFASAYWGVVQECGCFGDFLKMTQWQSFAKNIILLLLIIPLFVNRNKIQSVFNRQATELAFAFSLFLSVVFQAHCLQYLPVWDFRPYCVGSNIKEEHKNVFSGTSEIPDFWISDNNGKDVTDSLLNLKSEVWLIVYKAKEFSAKKFEALAMQIQANGISLFALTNEPDSLKKYSTFTFPVYSNDFTVLETMIRSNGGMMLIKDGIVVDMWSRNNYPTIKRIKELLK